MKILLLILLLPATTFAGEFFGDISLDVRRFNETSPKTSDQNQVGIVVEPKYNHSTDNGRSVFAMELFGRADSLDENRTHFDIRQLDWVKATNEWEFRVGVRKVFWGVTESVHLVDIINQDDFVESFDGEQKLGQPMVNVAWVKDFGTFDFFVLPYFRERTFPGEEGRLGFPLKVADATYESKQEENHIDFAIRYKNSFGPIDLGLSFFDGTARDPLYSVNSSLEIVPFYDLIKHSGLDLQYTGDNLLLKLEYIYRDREPENYSAYAYGFEYTFTNIGSAGMDIGVLAEHLVDTREEANLTTPFENDLFVGSRVALNDVDDTQFLAGVIFDLEKTSQFFTLEASRRIGNNYEVSIENRSFLDIDADDTFVQNFETESYTQLKIKYSF